MEIFRNWPVYKVNENDFSFQSLLGQVIAILSEFRTDHYKAKRMFKLAPHSPKNKKTKGRIPRNPWHFDWDGLITAEL